MSVPIFIINLESSKERKHFMEEQMKGLGIANYSFTQAVDGKQLSKQHVQSLCTDSCLSPGEIGVYLSHYKIYRHMLAQGIEAALILEDDVHLSADLVELIGRSKNFPPDWMLIHAVDNSHDDPSFTLTSAWTRRRVYKSYQLGLSLCARTRASAYFIHQRGIGQLLPFILPIQQPIDMLLFSTKEARYAYPFHLLRPSLAFLSNHESTIKGRAHRANRLSMVTHSYRRMRKYLRWVECCVYRYLPPRGLQTVFLSIARMRNILGNLARIGKHHIHGRYGYHQ